MKQNKPKNWITTDHNLDDQLRRGLDIIISLLGLLVFSPFLCLIAIVIKNSSPGPVFYQGVRAGRFGKPFKILKFRTMYESDDSYKGPKITGRSDDRITPIGKFLRDTKLNEIPQLWNVLIGEMALVGPRPEDIEIVETWPAIHKKEILSVRPGITSPASIIYRWEEELLQSENVMDQYLNTILPDKLNIDNIYIQRRSLLVDLDIIFLTAAVLFPIFNQATFKRDQFYWGPTSRFISKFLNWFVIDLFISFFSISMAGILWRMEYPLDIGIGKFIIIALAASIIFSLINALLGLHNISWRHASYIEIIPLTISVACSYTILLFLDNILSPNHISIAWITFDLPFNFYIGLVTFAWLGFVFTRYNHRIFTGFAYHMARSGGTPMILRNRVLLIGAGQNANFAIWLLNNHFFKKFNISGIVDDEPRKQGMKYYGIPVIGTSTDIPSLVNKLDINMLIFTITEIQPYDRKRILDTCYTTNLPVVLIPDILDHVEKAFQGLDNA